MHSMVMMPGGRSDGGADRQDVASVRQINSRDKWRKNYCNYSKRRLITSVIGRAKATCKLLLCDNVGAKTLMILLHKCTFGPDAFRDTETRR